AALVQRNSEATTGHGYHPEEDEGSDRGGTVGDPGCASGQGCRSAQGYPVVGLAGRPGGNAAAARMDGFDSEEIRRPEDSAASPRRPAANDDQESIGNILRAIQRRPSNTSYLLASIFAGVWVLGGF